MDDENEKKQQTGEELRKRKKGVDEGRAEQRKDKARNFISEKATTLMERSLKDRGFIAKRGLKKVISHFAEMLEKRGWQSLGEHKEHGYASLVKEFFANMVEKEGKRVYVRGHWVKFSRETTKGWFEVKETTKGTITPENSRPTNGWKRRMERDNENPF